jgi:hypothetical protein
MMEHAIGCRRTGRTGKVSELWSFRMIRRGWPRNQRASADAPPLLGDDVGLAASVGVHLKDTSFLLRAALYLISISLCFLIPASIFRVPLSHKKCLSKKSGGTLKTP